MTERIRPDELKIGSTLWWYRGDDYNRRPKNERIASALIHGETKRSWLINIDWSEYKLPKAWEASYYEVTTSRTYGRRVRLYLNLEELEQELWVDRNRWGIADKVNRVHSYGVLKQIADLIGYEEK